MKPKDTNVLSSRDRRRSNRILVAEALKKSNAYIAVLWDGKDKNPLTVIDIAGLRGKNTPMARAFFQMAKAVAAMTRLCNERNAMTDAQRAQADLAEKVREQRSASLNAAAETDIHPNGSDKNPPASVNRREGE